MSITIVRVKEVYQSLHELDPIRKRVMLEYASCMLPCQYCNQINYKTKREIALIKAREKWAKYIAEGGHEINEKCFSL